MNFIKKFKCTMPGRVGNSLPTGKAEHKRTVGNKLPTLRGWLKSPPQYGRSIL